jgi:hypothetical protein
MSFNSEHISVSVHFGRKLDHYLESPDLEGTAGVVKGHGGAAAPG